MFNYKEHLIKKEASMNQALNQLDSLLNSKILFVVDEKDKLLGSITDGDIRRGLIKNGSMNTSIEKIYQAAPKTLTKDNIHPAHLKKIRKEEVSIIPIVDLENKIIDVLNFNTYKSYLPLDVAIMAGGKGSRLAPLTEKTPKPLLPVGDKPIMEHNVDRLVSYGIKNFWISVNYQKDQIINHFKAGKQGIVFNYIEENQPLGTIGALSMINDFENNHVLVTNSDLLTNLDYEDYYLDFLAHDADISMVTIPYQVVIPYGVVKNENNRVLEIEEKPTYTYFSNAGIYLMKKEVLESIPKNQFFNATDLVDIQLKKGKKVISYPFSGYWLDIGKHEDYQRAQNDIKHIQF